MESNKISNARLAEMIAEQNRWLANEEEIERRDNLIALINTYNESSSPSVPRTDAEHAIERQRAKTALGSIRRNYMLGVDYRELSTGALWPIQS